MVTINRSPGAVTMVSNPSSVPSTKPVSNQVSTMAQPQSSIKLQPPSVLLQGASGAGKTSSIVTLLLAGIEVFVIGTEPGFVDSLIDRVRELKAPMDKLHWMSVLPATDGFDA